MDHTLGHPLSTGVLKQKRGIMETGLNGLSASASEHLVVGPTEGGTITMC